MVEIWGDKTQACLDVWSIEHVFSGVSMAAVAWKLSARFVKDEQNRRLRVGLALLATLAMSLLWENAEHYMETGAAGEAVSYWLQGVEHPLNRMVFDNLAILLGFFLYIKKPVILVPAKVLAFGWLALHIFVFPHSMYLHSLW